MDRKAWIILIICGVLLAANLYLNSILREEQPKPTQNEQVDQGADNTEGPDEMELAGTTTSESLPAPEQEEQHTLTSSRLSKDGKQEVVEFTFTNLGGGVKFARFLQQLNVAHDADEDLAQFEDKFVRLNTQHRRAVGALLLDPRSDRFDTTLHEVVETTENSITFRGQTPSGLTVTKRFVLATAEGDKDRAYPYRLTLQVTCENLTERPVSVSDYGIYTGSAAPMTPREFESYGGFFFHTDGKFKRKSSGYFKDSFFGSAKDRFFRDDLAKLQYVGVMNQFFATILTPDKPFSTYTWAGADSFETARGDDTVTQLAVGSALGLPKIELGPNARQTFDFDLYMGPKHNLTLRSLDRDRGDVMDYGWFSIVSRPLNWLLNKLHGLFGNWGWAVVAITIIIRTLLWPIHNKSTRAMKRMQALQPKMQEIREKYQDDPQKMNMKVMELYRDYGVNPVGGCLPMLVQIPIFFGFYKMLMFAVELRNEGWLGWVNDLSQPDTVFEIMLPFGLPFIGNILPINILPFLMAGTMLLQMKLSPKPADKMQARIMMFMPIIFFVFCYNFASALALYWTTQNIFTIGQTLYNNRLPEPVLTKRKTGKKGGKSFLQKMAEAQEAKQREIKSMRQAGSNVTDASKKKKRRGPKTGG